MNRAEEGECECERAAVVVGEKSAREGECCVRAAALAAVSLNGEFEPAVKEDTYPPYPICMLSGLFLLAGGAGGGLLAPSSQQPRARNRRIDRVLE